MKRAHFTDNYIINPTHRLTIALIGVGGTGSQVLTGLARIDYALQALGHPGLQVTAYDPDEVTAANIGRQLFSPADLGLNKANVLVTRINRFFGLDWIAVPERYGKDAPSANITISCVDTVKSRLEIAKTFTGKGIDQHRRMYWLDFGNTTDTGQVILGTVHTIKQPESKQFETVDTLKTVTELFDLKKVKDKDSGPSCSLAEALEKQDLFINSSLAQMGCDLLWKLIRNGIIEYQGLYLNLDSMKVNPIKI